MPRFVLFQAVPRDGLLFLTVSLAFFCGQIHALRLYDSVVTRIEGARSDDPEREAPSSLQIIPVSPEKSSRSISCADLLEKNVPGLTARPTGGIGSFRDVSLRGSGGGRVAVFLDDIPLNTSNGGVFNLGALSGSMIRQIEIYKGDAPIEFGQGVTGGLLRLSTSGGPAGNRFTAGLGGGSYGYKSATLGTRLMKPGLSLVGALEYMDADNDYSYRNNNLTPYTTEDDFTEVRRNDDTRDASGVTAFGALLPNLAALNGTLFYKHGKKGLPGYNNYNSTASFTENRDLSGQLFYRGPAMGEWKYRAGFSARRNSTRTRYAQNDFSYSSGRLIDRRDIENMVRPALQIERSFLDIHTLGLAAEGQWESLEPRALSGADVTSLSTERASAGLGLRYALKTGTLEPSASGFIRQGRSSRTAGVNLFTRSPISADVHDETYATGSAYLLYTGLTRTRLFASCHYLVNPPGLFQLFGDRGFMLPNELLKPEAGINAELGFRWDRGRDGLRYSGGAACFYHRLRNTLVAHKHQGQSRWENVDASRIAGLEAAQAIQLGRWRLNMNWTLQDPVNLSASQEYHGKLLPGQSRWVLDQDLTGLIVAGLEVFYRARYGGEYFTAPNNDLLHRIPSIWQHDMGLRWSRRGFEAALSFDNLTDQQRFDVYGFPIPGRMVIMKTSYALILNQKEKS